MINEYSDMFCAFMHVDMFIILRGRIHSFRGKRDGGGGLVGAWDVNPQMTDVLDPTESPHIVSLPGTIVHRMLYS